MKSVCVYVYLALTLAYSAVATCPLGRCTTVSGNIARHRNITSNSTCGDSYCLEEPCILCRNPSTFHGIENINDDSLFTWWESDRDTANVVIQLDLEAAMIFESTVIRWRSPRPMSMVLERSSDFGGTWIPYRYYSSSCGTTFGVTTYNRFALGMPPNQTEAICLAEDASISPMEGGEVSLLPLLLVKSFTYILSGSTVQYMYVHTLRIFQKIMQCMVEDTGLEYLLEYHIRFNFHTIKFSQYSRIFNHLRNFTCTCKNLDWVLVQWQNMTIHEYKNTKITKSQDLQKFPPTKIRAYVYGSYCLMRSYIHERSHLGQ